MADEKTASNGADLQTANAAGDKDTSAATQQESASEVNARLLDESKKNKARALAAEKRIEEIEKAKLAEQGHYKQMFEAAEQKLRGLQETLKNDKRRESVNSLAGKAGCQDLEALMKLGNMDLLSVDEESLQVQGADMFVADAKARFPYLFAAKSSAVINPTTPGGAVTKKKLTPAEMAKLPKEQQAKLWTEALSRGAKK